MTGRPAETFALSYRDPVSGWWWFIPTVPAARKWRGPHATVAGMQAKAQGELGDGVTIIETKCRPAQLRERTGVK